MKIDTIMNDVIMGDIVVGIRDTAITAIIMIDD
jgi:hypothetical protein